MAQIPFMTEDGRMMYIDNEGVGRYVTAAPNSAWAENQAETFADLLDAYGYAEHQVARSLAYDSEQERQAILAYVARLEARIAALEQGEG